MSETYGRLPLSFEANRGQTDPQVRFLSRSTGHTLFFTSTEAVLVLTKSGHFGSGKRLSLRRAKPEKPGDTSRTVLRMAFLGKNPAVRVTGQEELSGKVNYLIGNEPAKWRTNVPIYARVQYRDLYPGIDLIYYGNEGQLEYDFVVRPGGDPARITIGVEGANVLEVDAQGDLVIHTAAGAIRQRKPVIYQEFDGRRHAVAGGYMLRAPHQIGFVVRAYDRSRPLILDPVMVLYSTYLGGNSVDVGQGIAVDAQGDAYVTGSTSSPNFPVNTGPLNTPCTQCPYAGNEAFVTKLNPKGTDRVYSTYLGGSANNYGQGIAVDAASEAYVAGGTTSKDFPTTPGAYQGTIVAGEDVFVTKLNSSGNGLVYSTLLGGSADEAAFGIAVDAAGNAYVTGVTSSIDFHTTPGAFQPSVAGAASRAFVAMLTPAGNGTSDLVYSTYLDGGFLSEGLGIAVDGAGNAYVTGATNSTDFPTTPGAYQTVLNTGTSGIENGFVAKINPRASGSSSLVYSTFLGGNADDRGIGIAVDTAGNAYVTGWASSVTFPTTPGAFKTSSSGGTHAFVTKLTPAGKGSADLVYSTYFGGSGRDEGDSIAVDPAGNAYVTGSTSSTNFPTKNAAQATLGGFNDNAFVAELTPAGRGSSDLIYSTYLGGSGPDAGYGIALDGPGIVYVTGLTESTNFPTSTGAAQTSAGGGGADAFVAKILGLIVPQWFQAGIPGATDTKDYQYTSPSGNFWGPLPYDDDTNGKTQCTNPITRLVGQCTIQQEGCALTALTMLVNFWKGNLISPTGPTGRPFPGVPPSDETNPLDPTLPNKWIGLFEDHDGKVEWNVFGRVFNTYQHVRVYPACPQGSTDPSCAKNTFLVLFLPNTSIPDATQTLVNILRHGVPVVLPIQGTGGERHYVVVTGPDSQDSGAFFVNDPGDKDVKTLYSVKDSKGNIIVKGVPDAVYAGWDDINPDSVTKSLNNYFNWKVYTNIQQSLMTQDPNTPQALGIYTEDPVELIVTDPLGRRTGFDPVSNTSYQEIPTSAYSTSVYSDEATFSVVGPPSKALDMANQMNGQYTLNVIGTGSSAFTIELRSSDAAGNWITQTYSGITAPGVSSQFTFQGAVTTFGAFSANVGIKNSANQVAVGGQFTLGAGSSGINPVTQPVTLQVGSFLITIPAGSFQRDHKGNYVFQGTVNGVQLAAGIQSQGGNQYAYGIAGQNATNLPSSNPIDIRLAIGSNGGDTSVSATFF